MWDQLTSRYRRESWLLFQFERVIHDVEHDVLLHDAVEQMGIGASSVDADIFTRVLAAQLALKNPRRRDGGNSHAVTDEENHILCDASGFFEALGVLHRLLSGRIPFIWRA